MGKGGVETPQDYPGAFIYHLNIGNMYRMQSSFQALMKLLLPGGVEDNDKTWWSSVESTRWLEHVRLLLEGSLKIARVLELEGSSVLVHCSDGWDRTSQLVSLAQLMIDPYYRTIRGFAVLVEKDWCAFGHKLAERSGGDRNRDNARHKSSPIMLQFLDAVWQIWRQFRSAFEFNERFLLHVANSLTSGLFGTFLYDTRVDREINRLSTRTVSVWTPVLLNVQTYTNPEYIEWTKPIWPWTGSPMIRLWEGYFFQWHPKYFDCGWISSLVHYGPLQDAQSTNSNLFTRMNCRDSTLASSQQREKDVTQEKEEEEEEVDDEVEERKDSSIANIPVPTSFLSLSRSSLGASNRSSCHSSSKWNLFLFNK
jgi:myotubularin-related protein 1/2